MVTNLPLRTCLQIMTLKKKAYTRLRLNLEVLVLFSGGHLFAFLHVPLYYILHGFGTKK
jgi:hypothetical protein